MTPEPVDWRADGVPRSERFDDIYHTESGALAQARHVFLQGCGLPGAWAGQPQWRILETGFGLGLNFLTAWAAWRADAQRPRLLHVVSIEAYPVSAADLRRAASAYPELAALADALAAQWHGLLPGIHRLAFDEGRVLLTLCVGEVEPMLRALQRFDADSLFLDGFSPQRNPEMWSDRTLAAVSRFARRGTRLATWTVARPVRDALTQAGFQCTKAAGLPPKRDCLQGLFEPAWAVRRPPVPAEVVAAPGRCAVIGAGLAGAAVAASLALRGWQVTVLDSADHPAAGASGLPAGVLAPHVSPDDALLSRLTRAGIRATWHQLRMRLEEGRDWAGSGVLERRVLKSMRLPEGWQPDGPNESWTAGSERLAALGLPPEVPALWHARAGWVKPARLIAAWLATPGVRFEGGRTVAHIARTADGWALHDAAGRTLAEADRVVIAAGIGSRSLAPALPLNPVRGQLAWGRVESAALPAAPINGDGHLIGHIPDAEGPLWLAGATFERQCDDAALRPGDIATQQARLAELHPGAAAQLAGAFAQGRVQAWAGVRCASGDRRPLVGPLDAGEPTGPWVCTALGSRGLSFAALAAELLAAQWHAEPLPLPAALARALDTRRLQKASSAPRP